MVDNKIRSLKIMVDDSGGPPNMIVGGRWWLTTPKGLVGCLPSMGEMININVFIFIFLSLGILFLEVFYSYGNRYSLPFLEK